MNQSASNRKVEIKWKKKGKENVVYEGKYAEISSDLPMHHGLT